MEPSKRRIPFQIPFLSSRPSLISAIMLGLLLSACRSTPRTLPPSPVALAEPLPPIFENFERILAEPLSRQARYESVSAAVQIARQAQQEVWLDRLLEQQSRLVAPDPLAYLFLFWWVDNALLTGAWQDAEQRLTLFEQQLLTRPNAENTQLLLMEQPLSEYVHERRSVLLERTGQLEAAYRLLASRPLQSVALRSTLVPRQYRLAKQLLRAKHPLPMAFSTLEAPLVFPPRRFSPSLPVRPIEALEFKAPWQAGIAQRAGVLAEYPGQTLVRTLTYARSAESRACGPWRGGYYYAAGTHARARHAGRDAYTIDFTAASHLRHRYGRGSFGIELRAAAAGLVWQASYVTPTHEGARSHRTQPENNRVDIYHVPLEHFRLSWVISEHVVGDGAREAIPRPLRLRDAWDYQTSYHHLAGIEGACAPGRQASEYPCIPRPALLSPGLLVWAGSPVGYEDSTGYSFSQHLHFRISQTCRPGGATCTQPLSQSHTGMSVPMHLEGRALREQDVGLCLISTNTSPFEGWSEAFPTKPLLPSMPAIDP